LLVTELTVGPSITLLVMGDVGTFAPAAISEIPKKEIFIS